MSYEQCGPSLRARDLVDLPKTLFLKFGVAHREHFVDKKNFWLKMSSNRESKSHIHSTRISLRRGVEKLADPGKSNDLIKFASNFRPAHPEDRAVHKNIF